MGVGTNIIDFCHNTEKLDREKVKWRKLCTDIEGVNVLKDSSLILSKDLISPVGTIRKATGEFLLETISILMSWNASREKTFGRINPVREMNRLVPIKRLSHLIRSNGLLEHLLIHFQVRKVLDLCAYTRH